MKRIGFVVALLLGSALLLAQIPHWISRIPGRVNSTKDSISISTYGADVHVVIVPDSMAAADTMFVGANGDTSRTSRIALASTSEIYAPHYVLRLKYLKVWTTGGYVRYRFWAN